MPYSFTTRQIELILVLHLENITTFLFVVRFSKFKFCQKAHNEGNTAIWTDFIFICIYAKMKAADPLTWFKNWCGLMQALLYILLIYKKRVVSPKIFSIEIYLLGWMYLEVLSEHFYRLSGDIILAETNWHFFNWYAIGLE